MDTAELKKIFRDYGAAVFLSVTFALIVRSFFLEAYRIPTAVMRPTLEPGDTLFVSKWPYHFWDHQPARGEIIVYAPASDPRRDFIKRVIALPGERVEAHGAGLSVNGKPLSQKTETKDACGPESVGDLSYQVCREPPLMSDFGPIEVPPKHVLVVGDLRSEPNERGVGKHLAWELIPLSAIKGRALWLWLSIDPNSSDSLFSRIRFERMLKRIH